MSDSTKFPVFREPDDYMRMREKPNFSGRLKKWYERRALDRCMEDLHDVKIIADVPSGPGRLFSYWKERGCEVHGVDFSEEMAEAAAKTHLELGLSGSTRRGNAFDLSEEDTQPDLVASVRFAYYFDRAKRIELLRSLARYSRRYVLVQYKTTQTLKGYINESKNSESRRRDREVHMAKTGCSHYEIMHEISEAGLVPLRIEVIGEFSDRVFVLAEKRQEQPSAILESKLVNIRPPRRMQIATMLLVLFAIVYCMNIGEQTFWTKEEALYSLAARSVTEGHVLLPMLDANNPAPIPPLAPWWIAAFSSIFGQVTEITARLSNVIATIAVLALLHGYVRRLVNPWMAMLSIAILGSAYEFLSNAGEAGFEMLFTALLMISWTTAFRVLEEGKTSGRVLLLWLTCALALLTGGSFALPLTLFVLLGYCMVRFGARRGIRQFMNLHPISGAICSLLPYAAWFAAIAWTQHGWQYVQTILSKELVGQVLIDWRDYNLELDSLAQILMNLMPWSLLLPFIAWDLLVTHRRRGESLGPLTIFSLCAVLFGCAFFILLLNNQDWHLLPLMPWGAILIANYLWRRITNASAVNDADSMSGRLFGGRLLGLKLGRAIIATFAVIMLVVGLYRAVALPLMDRDRSIKPLAEAVESAVDSDDNLILFDYHDPRLMYYLREKYTILEEDGADMARLHDLLRSGQQYDLVLKRSAAKHLTAIHDVPLYIEATATYRGERYYIITTEHQPGMLPFNSLTGKTIRRLEGPSPIAMPASA